MDAALFSTLSAREVIARRAAQELADGQIVNLGIGIPTLTANYLPVGVNVIFHTENGAFGFGARPPYHETDSDVTNAGCEPVTLLPGAAIMDLATSLGAMRKGYIDVTILGALEADQHGNLANWATRRSGRWWPGIGGAMDLCYGTPKVVAALCHTGKSGESKIRRRCALPLTGRGCVKVIITDKAVFDVRNEHLVLREAAPGMDPTAVGRITEAEFEVAPDFRPMRLDLGLGPRH